MKFHISRIAAAIIIIVMVAIGAVATFEYLYPQQNRGLAICTTCFVNQQVVDVVIPSLVSTSGGGANNLELNATRGENLSLIVQVFPSQDLNLTMGLHILSFPVSGSANSLSANFNPRTLSIAATTHGNTTVMIRIRSDAALGAYTLAVTAVNLENTSQSWGTEINLNVA